MGLRDDLLEELVKGRVLLVVGSGVSIQASGGHPCAQWAGLIEDGLRHCVERTLMPAAEAEALRTKLASKKVTDLLAVAEKISKVLGAPDGGEYRGWLQDSVGRLEPKQPRIIEALHDLDVPLATTNYDRLLARGRELEAVPWTEVEKAQEIIRGDRQGVLHLHGYYDEPPSVVLGVRSYKTLLASRGAQAIQQAVAAERTLLFVGCGDGLSDPNFGALLDWVSKLFGGRGLGTKRRCLCTSRWAPCSGKPIALTAWGTLPSSVRTTRMRGVGTRRRCLCTGRWATCWGKRVASTAWGTLPSSVPTTGVRGACTKGRCPCTGKWAPCWGKRIAS